MEDYIPGSTCINTRRNVWIYLGRVPCDLSDATSVYPACLGYCESDTDPVYTWTWKYSKRVPCSKRNTSRRTILWSEDIMMRIAEHLVYQGRVPCDVMVALSMSYRCLGSL